MGGHGHGGIGEGGEGRKIHLLQVLAFGDDPTTLAWQDPPPAHALLAALDLLGRLGATQGGRLTRRGHELAAMPAHPRLAAVLHAAHHAGLLGEANLYAKLL